MIRILIIGSALLLALTTPATAQKKVSVDQALTQLNGLCERDYKPACIKFGLIISKIPPREARKLRSAHPEWWWWEKW
jgi:hypothetical protein